MSNTNTARPEVRPIATGTSVDGGIVAAVITILNYGSVWLRSVTDSIPWGVEGDTALIGAIGFLIGVGITTMRRYRRASANGVTVDTANGD
jgi:hypothetical protein